ncbi:hypothetical protein F903_00301 [Acinetobacter sp. NIPH 298]|nr:hypothetical protein F903_00301 [Acinetobacter sp. NIPH 298]
MNQMRMIGMSKKSEVKTRKGQLIHTFGPGAMQVNKNGVSMIACGLDYWFTKDGTIEPLSLNVIDKYKIDDKRLSNKLGVNHFRVPPNAITIDGHQKVLSPIPASRFPYWHICSNTNCQRLVRISPTREDVPKCESCSAPVYQSRFVCGCSNGHLQDFPWFEWLNNHNGTECNESTCKLALVGTGSTTISGVKVKCLTHASKPVTLAGIFTKTQKGNGESSSTLQEKGVHCSGHSPWLGCNSNEVCNQPLVAVLRQATNIYFSKTDSSIKIPKTENNINSELEEQFESLPLALKDVINASGDLESKVAIMMGAFYPIFSKEEIEEFLKGLQLGEKDFLPETDSDYKFQEYQYLLQSMSKIPLVTKPLIMDNFEGWFQNFFSAVTQVKELTITNAFYGFDRIEPQINRTIDNYKKSLRKSTGDIADWLPAVQIQGEGIFLQFNLEKIKQWSLEFEKEKAFRALIAKAEKVPLFQNIGEIGPAFLLVHTFSHLLMNQLIFDCGYSTASLRERLYVSNTPEREMCGLLIYTAAGDSEGSLGGLVRMAEPSILQPVIKKAIESSNWCSSDPICREVGNDGGQGPAGMNLAACHNCALLPETSCEVFNSLLDRGAITSKDLSCMGYFDELLTDSRIS